MFKYFSLLCVLIFLTSCSGILSGNLLGNSSDEIQPPANIALASSGTSITVTWQAPLNNSASDYQISYAIGASSPADCESATVIHSADISGLSHTVTNLNSASVYSFRICSVNAESEISDGVTASLATEPVVEPLHALAPNWNDYFVRNHYKHFDASNNVACVGNETGTNPCLHGGDKKKVVLNELISCTNLTAEDSVGALSWTCDDNSSAGPVTIFSTGLLENKRLSDLLNTTSWKQNSVVIKKSGLTIAETALSTWYTNPVRSLDTLDNDQAEGASALTNIVGVDTGVDTDIDVFHIQSAAEGTVYTLAADKGFVGFFVDADKISLSVFPGATLSYLGSGGDDNNESGGATGTSRLTLLFSNSATKRKHLWVEGRFQGTTSVDRGLTTNVIMSRYRYVELYNFLKTSSYALSINDTQTIFNKVRLANNFRNALVGANNVINQLIANNHRDAGLVISSGSEHSITQVLSVGNQGAGTTDQNVVPYHHGNTVNAATFAKNLYGLTTTHLNSVFSNVLAAGNAFDGIRQRDGLNSFHNIVSSHNTNFGVYMESTTTANYSGYVHINGNTSGTCNAQPGATNNFDISESNCQGTGIVTDLTQSLASSFVAQVANTADALNSHGSSLGANNEIVFSSIIDFLDFDNTWRVWQKTSGVAPGSIGTLADQGDCVSSDDCEIWDWRLKLTDTSVRNINGTFVNLSACPASVHGNETLTDGQTPANTYLINAIELFDDGLGDEDGLCESNESCVFAPNAGAYQGEGSLGSCEFDDDVDTTNVTNVIMKGYLTNGN